MIGNKGGFYHIMVAIAIIVLAGMVWTVMGQELVTIQGKFNNITPDGINSSVHSTAEMKADYSTMEAIFYFSMFGIGVLLLFWAYKRSQEQRAFGGGGGL